MIARSSPVATPDLQGRILELERELADKDELLARERRIRESLAHGHSARGHLLSVLSQDLRPSLNAIAGWSRMLQHEMLDKTGRDHVAATIERDAVNQLALLDELLDISQLGLGKLALNLETIEIAGVVEMVVEGHRSRALERGVAVTFENQVGHGRVLADAFRFQQIIGHLLSNALLATPTAGRILIELTQKGSWLRLSVHDGGSGSSAERLPLLLDGYRPSVRGAMVHGRGIGLHIVRRLVEVHRGRATAASGGKCGGVVFTVELPYCHDPRAPEVPRAARTNGETSAARPEGRIHGARVLVVDDDVDARDLLGALLRSKGASVALASKVSTALGLFDAWKPDVVLCDILFPEHDGRSLARDLRARHPALPIIALSGLAGAEQVSDALRSGFDSFVPKPLHIVELVEALERVLPPRRSRPTSVVFG